MHFTNHRLLSLKNKSYISMTNGHTINNTRRAFSKAVTTNKSKINALLIIKDSVSSNFKIHHKSVHTLFSTNSILHEIMDGIDKRKMSFGFSLGDERIKLIDIVSDNNDDDFLLATPFSDSGRIQHFDEQALFRLSGFGCSQDVDMIQQTAYNRFPADATEGRSRPSYLRKSLAWDTAFTNSAGVLDPDELSLINKGFGADSHLLPATLGVHKRRPESETPVNGDMSFLDWFDIEPFDKKRPATYKSNSVKGFNTATMSLDLGSRNERLRNGRVAPGKAEVSSRNKMISSQTAVRKSISLHTEDMKKLLKETTDRSRIRAPSSSAKPPKSWCRSGNDSTTSNRTDLQGKSNVKMTRFGPGQSMTSERQSGEKSVTSSTISTPFVAASPPRASFSTSKRITETEPRKSKLYAASLSTSKIFRGSEKSKGIGNETSHSKPQLKRPAFLSPASYSSQYSSQSLSSSLSKKRKSNVDAKTTKLGLSDSKEAAETSSVGSHLVKNSKPSKLRPPSPKMGFFDEATGSRGTRRKMLQNVESEKTFLGPKPQFHSSEELPNSSISSGLSSTCSKLRSGILDTARKIKRSKTYLLIDKEKLQQSLRVGDGKRSRSKLGFNSSMEEEKIKDPSKNKRYKGSPGPVIEDTNTIKKRNGQNVLNGSEDQIGNLSRFFEAIALDQDRTKHFGHRNKTGNKGVPVFSKQENQLTNSPIRTPLADKSSVCNSTQPRPLQLEPYKEKLPQTESVYIPSLGNAQGDTMQD